MLIQVAIAETQIRLSRPKSPNLNAVARAICAALSGQPAFITADTGWGDVRLTFRRAGGGPVRECVPLPQAAQDWLERHRAGEPVEPLSFALPVPDRLLRAAQSVASEADQIDSAGA